MSSRTNFALLLLVVLGVVLKYSAGMYHPGAVTLLALGMGGMATLIFRSFRNDNRQTSPYSLDFALGALIFLFAYLLQRDPMLDFVPIDRETGQLTGDIKHWYYLHAITLQVMPFLAALLWWQCLAPKRSSGWLREVVVALMFITLVFQRFATVHISPYAEIDVWVTNELACSYLLEGLDPYSPDQWYPDIYHGSAGYAPGFGYWPGYLYWATPFKYFFGDVRYSSATADVLTSLVLVLIGRKLELPRRTLWFMPLVWLIFPVGMYVVEHAWIDPSLIFFSSLVLLALLYEQWMVAGLMVGWIAGTKQYGGLVGLTTVVYVAAHHRERLLRVVLSAAGVFAGLLGPFLWLSPRGLFDKTIGVFGEAPLRADALSLVGLWLNTVGIEPSGAALTGVALSVNLLAISGACWWLFRARDTSLVNWAGSLMVCYFAFFFTGKFAYCNYYYLVSFFVLAYFMLAWAEDVKQDHSQAPQGVA